jgi:hypothetical protein
MYLIIYMYVCMYLSVYLSIPPSTYLPKPLNLLLLSIKNAPMILDQLDQDFSITALLTFGAREFLVRGCPVQCRMLALTH